MNKFIGTFQKVDILLVYPNTWNPKESIEDNNFNYRKYEQIKENIKNKGLYEPIKVRQVGDKFEILDGYHRYMACKELEFTEILVWNLGEVSDEQARGITLDSIYLSIPASEPLTAQIIKEINENNPLELKFLPFNDIEIAEYLKMADFKWGEFKKELDNNELKNPFEKEVECPECGHKFTI